MLVILGGLVVAVFSISLNGWVMRVFWGWFIVPVFGVDPITIPQAIGLSVIVGYLTRHLKNDDSYVPEGASAQDKVVYALVMSVVTSLFFLGMGYVVHLFVQ